MLIKSFYLLHAKRKRPATMLKTHQTRRALQAFNPISAPSERVYIDLNKTAH